MKWLRYVTEAPYRH